MSTTTPPPRRRRTSFFSFSLAPASLMLLLVLLLRVAAAFTLAGQCVKKDTRHRLSTSMAATPSNDQRGRGQQASRSNAIPREQHLRWSSTAAASLLAATAGLTLAPRPTPARMQPLGVIDELLAECPTEKSCASSQDDRPPVFQEPWQYDDATQEKAMRRLRGYVESLPGVEMIAADERYFRAEIKEAGGSAVDEMEFFFTPNDSIIQFRAARLGDGNDRGANQKRMEKIRIALGFEKIPVLRNRRRALFFLESPLDGWGPSYREDAPNPEELQQAYKDNDPLAPEWESPSPYPRPPGQAPGRK